MKVLPFVVVMVVLVCFTGILIFYGHQNVAKKGGINLGKGVEDKKRNKKGKPEGGKRKSETYKNIVFFKFFFFFFLLYVNK